MFWILAFNIISQSRAEARIVKKNVDPFIDGYFPNHHRTGKSSVLMNENALLDFNAKLLVAKWALQKKLLRFLFENQQRSIIMDLKSLMMEFGVKDFKKEDIDPDDLDILLRLS